MIWLAAEVEKVAVALGVKHVGLKRGQREPLLLTSFLHFWVFTFKKQVAGGRSLAASLGSPPRKSKGNKNTQTDPRNQREFQSAKCPGLGKASFNPTAV